MSDATVTKPLLDDLRETLQRAGYCVKVVTDPLVAIPYLRSARSELAFDNRSGDRLSGIHRLSRGCAVSLRFGDQVVVPANGSPRLAVQCRLRINGEDDRVAGTICWQIQKSFRRPIASERLDIAIEADLILGSDVAPADVLGHARQVYRCLRPLIADARDTLRGLPAARASANGSASPVVLIEARLLGDLAIGRSGLVASDRAALSASRLRMAGAACNWLRDGMLPELARALRAPILRAQPALSLPQQADATTSPHEPGEPGDPSIVPALEPVQ